MPLSARLFVLALLGLPSARAAPYQGLAQFQLGVHPTRLAIVQHADGSLALQADDGHRSVVCFGEDRAWWTQARTLLLTMAEGWHTTPSQQFSTVVPERVGAAHSCELSAYSVDHHLYVEVVGLEDGVRAGYAKVELSPIAASHSIVEVLAVQRVEDNTFGVRLAQAAAAATAALAGEPSSARSAVIALEGGIEDTRTYNVDIIEAHSDLARFVLVLDTYLHSGRVASNDDIATAYRVRDILGDARPDLFVRVLSRVTRGESASSLVRRLQACGPEADPIVCLE